MSENQPLVSHAAVFANEAPILGLLLAAGGDPNAPGFEPPLCWCTHHDNGAGAKLLIRYGAIVDWEDADGMTALGRAAFAHEGRVARVLVDAGANVNHVNRYGMTPLTLGIASPEIVRLLLPKHPVLPRSLISYSPLGYGLPDLPSDWLKSPKVIEHEKWLVVKMLVKAGVCYMPRTGGGAQNSGRTWEYPCLLKLLSLSPHSAEQR
jgi:hypothetical protein